MFYRNIFKQAGAELSQAQPKLGLWLSMVEGFPKIAILDEAQMMEVLTKKLPMKKTY